MRCLEKRSDPSLGRFNKDSIGGGAGFLPLFGGILLRAAALATDRRMSGLKSNRAGVYVDSSMQFAFGHPIGRYSAYISRELDYSVS